MNQVIKHKSIIKLAAGVKSRGLPFGGATASRRCGAFLTLPQLESYLTTALAGQSLEGLPLKTRSKFVRRLVIEALGYDAPIKHGCGIIFPAQNADIYVQKANNLQIWNDKIDPLRRYVVVIVGQDDAIVGVRAFTGRTLSKWSRTGTLTTKFQARLKLMFSDSVDYHVCGGDTERTIQFTGPIRPSGDASTEPTPGSLIPIQALAERLSSLIGTCIPHVSAVDEKKRSAVLLGIVGKTLGYNVTAEASKFPDLPGQMLAVKLQTSGTIDLGRTWPSSDSPLDFQNGRAKMLRRRDARFAVFYGTRVGNSIRLDKLVVTPGARFWDVFEPLKGKERNTKLQIKLPAHAMAI